MGCFNSKPAVEATAVHASDAHEELLAAQAGAAGTATKQEAQCGSSGQQVQQAGQPGQQQQQPHLRSPGPAGEPGAHANGHLDVFSEPPGLTGPTAARQADPQQPGQPPPAAPLPPQQQQQGSMPEQPACGAPLLQDELAPRMYSAPPAASATGALAAAAAAGVGGAAAVAAASGSAQPRSSDAGPADAPGASKSGQISRNSSGRSTSGGGGRPSSSGGGRSVKFAEPAPADPPPSSGGGGRPQVKRSLPRRSQSHYAPHTSDVADDPAVLAKQVDILRANKTGKLRARRGGLDSSFAAMQEALITNERPVNHVNTRAAGLKHIGFGPFKRENQDEFFIQVGDFGGVPSSNLFCVFDGHGNFGKDAALYSRQLLPRLLDVELRKYYQRVVQDSEEGLKGAVEVLLIEVFGDTERSLSKSGVNLASSGTTASVAYQRGNRLWVAAVGDSRAILCSRNSRDQWRAVPLTIDHRPRRPSERERIEAAGARVAPKRLPSGRMVGEPRLWLQNAGGPGLLLSRSLGDLTAATVGCTSDPEVSYTTLRPHVDHVLVMASDGVWDVLTNEQVCDIVVESPDPHIACRRVLDAALYEWEERMSADNITVLVVEFDWAEEGSTASAASIEASPPSLRAEGAAAAADLAGVPAAVAAMQP